MAPTDAAPPAVASKTSNQVGWRERCRAWCDRRPLRRNFTTDVLLSAAFLAVYLPINHLTAARHDVHLLYLPWERKIPFIPLMVIPYLSDNPLFLITPLLCTTQRELTVYVRRMLLSLAVAAACFLIYPVREAFPRPPIGPALNWLFVVLGFFDRPFNLFPSLHVSEVILMWTVIRRHTAGLIRILIGAWLLLIIVSTLFTFQHHMLDIIAGAALAWGCVVVFPFQELPEDQERQPRDTSSEPRR